MKDLIKQWIQDSPLMEFWGGPHFSIDVEVYLSSVELRNTDNWYILEVFIEAGTNNLAAYSKKENTWWDSEGQAQESYTDTSTVDMRAWLNMAQYEELRGLLKTHGAAEILRRATTCKS